MKLIAHRGNTAGARPEFENTIPYLLYAVRQGYDVEFDIWKLGCEYYLGHDYPATLVQISELELIGEHGWFHAKNINALNSLKGYFNTFFHNNDDMTLTSSGFIWSHNGIINPGGIVCMPDLEQESYLLHNAAGVCHDDLMAVQAVLATVGSQ